MIYTGLPPAIPAPVKDKLPAEIRRGKHVFLSFFTFVFLIFINKLK